MKQFVQYFKGPFWGAKLMLILLIVLTSWEAVDVLMAADKQLSFAITPINNTSLATTTLSDRALLVATQSLQMKTEKWYHLLVLDNQIGMAPLQALSLLIVYCCSLIALFQVQEHNYFQKDISGPLGTAAFALIAYFFIERYMHRSFREDVLALTNNQYKLAHLNHTWMIWLGIGLGWLSRFMKRGYLLQQEQNLTI
jgi:hypothetical protein